MQCFGFDAAKSLYAIVFMIRNILRLSSFRFIIHCIQIRKNVTNRNMLCMEKICQMERLPSMDKLDHITHCFFNVIQYLLPLPHVDMKILHYKNSGSYTLNRKIRSPNKIAAVI
ncbi:hypothetical protein T12_13961 [Trichinella patagoniensis]|uniref:Uncharacterized protein n=1 Tax=Trichinella patagoniensis TaxID=990121 RepID=A0A0V1A216_9BILA|nr:hypothetical protein T12_13961 [Trichinella patagoniensis]